MHFVSQSSGKLLAILFQAGVAASNRARPEIQKIEAPVSAEEFLGAALRNV